MTKYNTTNYLQVASETQGTVPPKEIEKTTLFKLRTST